MTEETVSPEFEIQRLIAYIPFKWSAFKTLQICCFFFLSD